MRPPVSMARLPRTRGDGPPAKVTATAGAPASPHTRGWTREDAGPRREAAGFPAHAGMDPRRASGSTGAGGLPRTRGDGPSIATMRMPRCTASPHTRGWTLRCSPRGPLGRGFPAHAGMDPRARPAAVTGARLPRTRGDGPRLPGRRDHRREASPHTRGWTRHHLVAVHVHLGFPAHAGMDPAGSAETPSGSRLPRTRGDGPGWGRM